MGGKAYGNPDRHLLRVRGRSSARAKTLYEDLSRWRNHHLHTSIFASAGCVSHSGMRGGKKASHNGKDTENVGLSERNEQR
jgi:hypothetical protein